MRHRETLAVQCKTAYNFMDFLRKVVIHIYLASQDFDKVALNEVLEPGLATHF